jgi:ABC-type nickel/cobalt efflux system permease component RcnA
MMSRRAGVLLAVLALVLALTVRPDAQLTAPIAPASPPGMGPAGGLAGEAQPQWLRGVLARVNAAQRQLNQALSRELRRLRGGEVTGAALGVAWIAFLYGVLHAVGPGHGKLVVSSLFLARDVRLRTALGISWLVSVLQTMSAIAMVSVVALTLGRGGFDVLHDSRRVELACYGLITLIGLVMLAGAFHEAWAHRRRIASDPSGAAVSITSSGLVLATGLTPCANAIIVLLFALGQGVYLVGVAASLVMGVGMGLTVSLVGLAAVAVQRGTLRVTRPSSAPAHWVRTTLSVAGAAAIRRARPPALVECLDLYLA